MARPRKGKQGTARVGNSLAGDLLKTNKRTMPKDAPIQAQATPGVVIGNSGFSGEIRFNTPNRYPKGLA